MNEFEKFYPHVNWCGLMGICRLCKSPILSIYMEKPWFQHDYQKCACKECAIDNGGEYYRIDNHPKVYHIMQIHKNDVFCVILPDTTEKIAYGYDDLVRVLANIFAGNPSLDVADIKIEIVSTAAPREDVEEE